MTEMAPEAFIPAYPGVRVNGTFPGAVTPNAVQAFYDRRDELVGMNTAEVVSAISLETGPVPIRDVGKICRCVGELAAGKRYGPKLEPQSQLNQGEL